MNLPTFAVNRPVTVFMMFAVLVLFGVLALTRLPVDLMPEFEFPVISVVTPYPGAGSEDIESNVTELVEDAMATISGVDHVNSVSQSGISVVMIEFGWDTDLNEAASDVRDALEMLKSELPDDVETPMIVKMSSANMPILVMGATAEENFPGIRHIVETQIADPLKAVPGVSEVWVFGGPEREIKVNVDPSRLEATGITPDQIVDVLAAENVDIPAGDMDIGRFRYTVRVPGKFQEVSELERIVVGSSMGRVIRLGDIADIEDGFAEQIMKARADRQDGLVFFVSKQSGANSVTIANAAIAKIEEIEQDLPPDMEIFTFFDTSDFIKKAINNLTTAIYFGGLGVILVVLLFLRRIRSTIVIGLTIPASFMVALFVMYMLGYTINMVSLMSLSIAIGLVVDAAVVVLENITRHVESGERVREASMFAPSEIGEALAASTLTTIVVFVPMIFISGIVGVLSEQMAVVVIAAIAVSLFSALTLIPALSSTLLRKSFEDEGGTGFRKRVFDWGERVFRRVEERYTRLLSSSLGRRKRTVFVAIGLFAVTILLAGFVKTEFFPAPDSGEIEAILELAPGTTVDRTMEVLGEIEEFIEEEIPEREYMYTFGGETGSGWGIIQGEAEGSHVGHVGLKLVDKELRDRSSEEVGDALRAKMESMPDVVKHSVRTGSSVGQMMGLSGTPISVQIKGSNMEDLVHVAEEAFELISDVPGAVDVAIDVGDPRPEFHIDIDRDRAATQGLNTYLIAQALRSQVFGVDATKLRQGGDQWQVVVRAPRGERSSVEDLMAMPIPSVTGSMVRLSSVADVRMSEGPTEIKHEDQQRIVAVTGRISGRALGEVAGDVRRALEDLERPPGVTIELAGDVENQGEAFGDLFLLLMLSLALVYMVMASQFESLLDPFIIMFSVPFAFVGVVWAFLISNTPLSMTSFLGVVMLMGIVVNNAIVLVDYAKIMRKRGMELREAVMTAGSRRLRPVLMTAFTTIFGMLPLALMRYQGSEVWRPLGITMIGGLLVSTFVTLVLVPTVYMIFHTRIEARARRTR
ncbi:MAG: MMPL family transporter [Candidatus Eisenbacteria bacterium]|nr:MMPL family transporter [Candidatus Eisenbacteria bacterium]